jgi:hypothetical protein
MSDYAYPCPPLPSCSFQQIPSGSVFRISYDRLNKFRGTTVFGMPVALPMGAAGSEIPRASVSGFELLTPELRMAIKQLLLDAEFPQMALDLWTPPPSGREVTNLHIFVFLGVISCCFYYYKFLVSVNRNSTFQMFFIITDCLCDLVVRVFGYRSGTPGSIPGTTRKKSSGSGTASTQPREYNWGVTWEKSSGACPENREYDHRDPSRWPRGTLYPQKLAITSPTSGGRSVGVVRSRTQTMEFFLLLLLYTHYMFRPLRAIFRWNSN